jgi:hypothetical protein
MKFIAVPDTNKLIMNTELTQMKVTVRINLKWHNLDYPSFYLVGRHLTFPVTTKRNVPSVQFMLPTLTFGRLYHWPCVPRGESAAAPPLELWVRIPPKSGCLSLVSVVCCQVVVSATGWSLVQRSPTEYSVTECHSEASTWRHRPATVCCTS